MQKLLTLAIFSEISLRDNAESKFNQTKQVGLNLLDKIISEEDFASANESKKAELNNLIQSLILYFHRVMMQKALGYTDSFTSCPLDEERADEINKNYYELDAPSDKHTIPFASFKIASSSEENLNSRAEVYVGDFTKDPLELLRLYTEDISVLFTNIEDTEKAFKFSFDIQIRTRFPLEDSSNSEDYSSELSVINIIDESITVSDTGVFYSQSADYTAVGSLFKSWIMRVILSSIYTELAAKRLKNFVVYTNREYLL